ncbi:MAG: hypothetical protein ACK52I_19935 [Pseudomonadota bacterium]
MRYWLGTCLCAIAAFLLWRAHAHRSSVLALAPRAALLERRERAAEPARAAA